MRGDLEGLEKVHENLLGPGLQEGLLFGVEEQMGEGKVVGGFFIKRYLGLG